MAHLKDLHNLGTVSEMGFIFWDSFSLGSDSQAAVKKTGMIQLEKRSLLTLCQLEKIERLLQDKNRWQAENRVGFVQMALDKKKKKHATLQ